MTTGVSGEINSPKIDFAIVIIIFGVDLFF